MYNKSYLMHNNVVPILLSNHKLPLFIVLSLLFVSTISYASAQYVKENLPVPYIGNRTLAISINNFLAENHTRFLQIRFFDNNTNQTISHVTAFINITSSHRILLAELFHTRSGNLILEIEPMRSNETKSINHLSGNYSSAREFAQYYNNNHHWLVVNATIEPILGGFESSNNKNIIIHSDSFFNDNYTNYHFRINLYGMDNDDQVFSKSASPKFDAILNSSSPSSTTLFYNNIHISTSSLSNQSYQMQYLLPLEQLKSGLSAKNVVCNVGLELIIKSDDGSPACVTPNTDNILIERGWGHLP